MTGTLKGDTNATHLSLPHPPWSMKSPHTTTPPAGVWKRHLFFLPPSSLSFHCFRTCWEGRTRSFARGVSDDLDEGGSRRKEGHNGREPFSYFHALHSLIRFSLSRSSPLTLSVNPFFHESLEERDDLSLCLPAHPILGSTSVSKALQSPSSPGPCKG